MNDVLASSGTGSSREAESVRPGDGLTRRREFHMAATTLADLVEKAFTAHMDGIQPKLNTIIAQNTDIQSAQATMQADLLSIKVFLGVPDARIGATQADLDALSTRITGETTDIQTFDQAVTEPPVIEPATT